MPSVIPAKRVIEALKDAGIIHEGDRVRRVVIDIGVDALPIIHIERFGDERLLEVVPVLTGVQIRERQAEAS